MTSVDIFERRKDAFVLWAPQSSPPSLVIGTPLGDPPVFSEHARVPLARAHEHADLWVLDPASISPPLPDGVYHYWFQIHDTSPENRGPMLVTDPLAYTVDYALTQQPGDRETLQPASVIRLDRGILSPCNVDGSAPPKPGLVAPSRLASNNHLVMYELPTSWAKQGDDPRGVDVDVGTFDDVLALFDSRAPGARFTSVSAVRHEAILANLGINALELLPTADAKVRFEWGYATANYFAPDADLGSASALVRLVNAIHGLNIRFFTDVVMAFGHDPYSFIDFSNFHIRPYLEPDNPDSYQSSVTGVLRDGYGGNSWRFNKSLLSYDPESGDGQALVHPSWTFHRLHLARWMLDFGVDGLRIDSVNNIGNWAFVRSYKHRAWQLYNDRHGASADPAKFLVVGEELSMPVSMVHQGILDALWNEHWQGRLRAVILGESSQGDDFEWTVKKMVDCTLDDMSGHPRFTDGSQAINYITSHDIEGYRKERLYNFLVSNGVWDVAKRAKLAFALLLTSVGVPMIFAGEEFADQMDQSVDMGKKQTDPVNYGRKNDGGWRQGLFDYVANLVKFRTKCRALGQDDTDFFHVDKTRGAKIMAWRRGQMGQDKLPVVVVANFSDENTPGPEYFIPDWPERNLPGWREISQGREVPAEWVGREPLVSWEAKIYIRYQDQ